MSLQVYPCSGEADQLDWEPEPGFFILNMREDIAISLAKSFGQYAILTGEIGQPARLVWCVAP